MMHQASAALNKSAQTPCCGFSRFVLKRKQRHDAPSECGFKEIGADTRFDLFPVCFQEAEPDAPDECGFD